MMLGTDVSALSPTAATAAAEGLSIVVPVYNEAAGLALLHERIGEVAKVLRQRYRLACEVVYVDDGGADATLGIARGLAADALDVQVVSLSRNFGKEAGLMAGLDHARRGAVLFMDGDGQHPPDLVEKLVEHWIEGGYDVVYTAKAHRDNESLLRRLAVHGFYALINWGARQKIPEDAVDFRLLSPRAAAALRQLPERNRFFKGLASWIGFRQIRVDYEPAIRADGATTVRRRMDVGAARRIWLCGDDYGLSPGVNRAIRGLIERGRLNATSVMVVGPSVGRDEVDALRAAAASSSRCGIGLHVTLTAPFRPLTMHFRPIDGGMFPALAKLLRAGLFRRLDAEIIHAELIVQLAAFKEMFGRSPDFGDGHQHAQLFPQVRDAFLAAVKDAAPRASVRQWRRNQTLSRRLGWAQAVGLCSLTA